MLLIDRRPDGIAVLTLNDPGRRNAMADDLTAAWKRAVEDLRADAALRCVVVTGAGTAFSSGGELSWLAGTGDVAVPPLRDRMLEFYRTWLAIRGLEVPTIAAVNGHAVGAGLCLALACDLRYVARDAKLLAPFTALGLHPGMAATWLFPEVAGLPLAREMLLAGRVLTGAEAAGHGLVTRPSRARTCWRSRSPSPSGSPRRRRSRPGSPRSPWRTAATPTWSRRCAGSPSPSRSRWRPGTCARASRRSGRSAGRNSPVSKVRGRTAGTVRRDWWKHRRTVQNVGVDLR